MEKDKLLIYQVEKPKNDEISSYIEGRLRRSPKPYGIASSFTKDALGNWEIFFSAKQHDGNIVPHATELIAANQVRQATFVASPKGRVLIRENPGFLHTIAKANRQGKEVGEGWEGKVHEETVRMIKNGKNTQEQVAVKYYFAMVLPEGESSYDGVLYGVSTPGIDQMRVLQYLAHCQQIEGTFPGVHFVAPYLATLNMSVAPLIPHAANLQTELRDGLFQDINNIHNANISQDDKNILHTILLDQDKVLDRTYGEIDPNKRFTKVFSNASYNIIRGITAWLNSRKEALVAQGLLTSIPANISFYDATQRNIVISIPALYSLYQLWAQDPSIADNWIYTTQVDLDDPLLHDSFLQQVRQTAYVIEAMVTGGIIGRIGDDEY